MNDPKGDQIYFVFTVLVIFALLGYWMYAADQCGPGEVLMQGVGRYVCVKGH